MIRSIVALLALVACACSQPAAPPAQQKLTSALVPSGGGLVPIQDIAARISGVGLTRLPLSDVSATPTTPTSGLVVYSKQIAGRRALTMLDPNGTEVPLQRGFGFRQIGLIAGTSPSAAWSTFGNLAGASTTGTLTARTQTTTSLLTGMSRTGIVSASTAGSAAYVSSSSRVWRGNASGLGGFYGVWRFAVSDATLVTTANMFAGLVAASTGLTADAAPSTKTNLIGVGCDNGDTHLQLYAAGSAAQTRTDLGASFPINSTGTEVYELVLYAPPDGTEIDYRVRRLTTGDTATGKITNSAQLFDTSTFEGPEVFRSNGGTAAAVGIDVVDIYLESG